MGEGEARPRPAGVDGAPRRTPGAPGTGPGDALLEVRGLEKRYPARGWGRRRGGGEVRAVDGVSFDVRRGETLGLVGESGSGKSTVARTVLRLVEPTAGEIRFDGRDVRALGGGALRAFRRRAQIVFQDPFGSLNPRMRVGSALDEVLRVHALARDAAGRRARVRDLLERVGLRASQAGAFPHELSGGERQRICIARALAVEPELLVLDEPVSALDVSVRAQVVTLLAELQADLGLTYLFIAHDLALVEHVSDRVAVMYLGRIVETAPAEDLYRDPRHPYTRALLAAAARDPRVRGRERPPPLSGEPPDPRDPPSGCPFHPRCPHPAKDAACSRTVPPLEALGPARRVACIKEGEGVGEP